MYDDDPAEIVLMMKEPQISLDGAEPLWVRPQMKYYRGVDMDETEIRVVTLPNGIENGEVKT